MRGSETLISTKQYIRKEAPTADYPEELTGAQQVPEELAEKFQPSRWLST
jgi:hypothetical protein